MKTRTTLLLAVLLLTAASALAHSGKARFHLIVDTDGAADDLRTLCMLLGNREAEVLAVTACEGALTPHEAAERAAALLAALRHEGIPVGEGRSVGAPEPPWRARSRQIDWGPAPDPGREYPPAAELLAAALRGEEERVVLVALGALTNPADLLQRHPELAGRIERIVWYDSAANPPSGANCRTDPASARCVLASGVPVEIVAASPAAPAAVTEALLDTLARIATPHARRIVQTHRAAPLSRLVAARHLQLWDDLAALRLYAPELFTEERAGSVCRCTLAGAEAAQRVPGTIAAILRGKPDAESRVFYGFPTGCGLYAADVAPIVDEAIARHGASEWRAAVLTNELHGHLGIYATIGVKMGIRAREYFDIGVDDIEVTTWAGSRPPVSCMNDGLQVGTGATVGHGLITVAEVDRPKPEAEFRFKGKTLRLTLKPEYAERIRQDVQRGIARYGDLTEPYWQYVRELALRYWLDFDRHEIFDMQTGG